MVKDSTVNEEYEAFVRFNEDPLVQILKEQKEARLAVLDNPMKMKEIQEEIERLKSGKSAAKPTKKHHHHHHKEQEKRDPREEDKEGESELPRRKTSRHDSDSDAEEEVKEDKKRSHHKHSRHDSDSDAEEEEKKDDRKRPSKDESDSSRSRSRSRDRHHRHDSHSRSRSRSHERTHHRKRHDENDSAEEKSFKNPLPPAKKPSQPTQKSDLLGPPTEMLARAGQLQEIDQLRKKRMIFPGRRPRREHKLQGNDTGGAGEEGGGDAAGGHAEPHCRGQGA